MSGDSILRACLIKLQLSSPEPKNLHLVLPPPVAEPPAPVPTPMRPLLTNLPPRPQSTPLNPGNDIHIPQQLPGIQHVPQLPSLHDPTGQGARLHQMQRETQRLYQDIALLEQRMRALLQPTTFPNPQQPAPVNNNHNHTVEQLEQRMRALGQFTQVPAPGSAGAAMFGLPQRQAPMPPVLPGLPSFQNLIHQQQRDRAAQGLHGTQDGPGIPGIPGIPPSLSAPASGRASPITNRPDHTTTYTREGIGPNGQRWHMTVNETTTTVPFDASNPLHHSYHPAVPHPPNPHTAFPVLPPPIVPYPHINPQQQQEGAMRAHQHHVQEIQAILRNADRLNHAQQNRQGTPPYLPSTTVPPSAPSSSTSGEQPSDTPVVVPTLTPSNNPTAPIISNNFIAQVPVTSPSRALGQSTAYILSSPTGPQALLVSNGGVYWTPRPSSRRHSPTPGPAGAQEQAAAAVFPEYRNRAAHRAGRRHVQQENAPEPLNAPIVDLHANPAAAGAGGLAQFGPMLWLLVRLAGFVWFFTSGNTSWTRLLIISGLALLLFIANTGVFNGIAEQAWGPIRRHLEALIPLAGPDAALVPAANAAVVAQPERPAGEAEQANPGLRRRRRAPEPDPAEAAARILAGRRQNQGWLSLQIRRVEHAALLFLASLVPGVGERHIAAREAEATAAEAERQRQVDAANAEEAAANAEEAHNEGNNGASSVGGTGTTEGAPPDRLVDI